MGDGDETVMFVLPDGSQLLLPPGASAAALDELETWSLVAEGDAEESDGPHRGDPVAWGAALSAGALGVAAIQGVVGNAVWSVFPAAARFLQSMREGRAPKDAVQAADIARDAAVKIHGGSASDVVVDACERTPAGTWSVRLTKGSTRLAVTLDATGAAVRVRRL